MGKNEQNIEFYEQIVFACVISIGYLFWRCFGGAG
jgi:hypothetical protein